MPKPYVKWCDRRRSEKALIRLGLLSPKEKPLPAKRVNITCQVCGNGLTKTQDFFCSRSCQSKANALANLKWEKALALKLEQQGWDMLIPSSCCDRIGIKNGKIYFVEFKPYGRGQELRPFQKKVQSLMPERYKVVVATYDEDMTILTINGRRFGR